MGIRNGSNIRIKNKKTRVLTIGVPKDPKVSISLEEELASLVSLNNPQTYQPRRFSPVRNSEQTWREFLDERDAGAEKFFKIVEGFAEEHAELLDSEMEESREHIMLDFSRGIYGFQFDLQKVLAARIPTETDWDTLYSINLSAYQHSEDDAEFIGLDTCLDVGFFRLKDGGYRTSLIDHRPSGLRFLDEFFRKYGKQ